LTTAGHRLAQPILASPDYSARELLHDLGRVRWSTWPNEQVTVRQPTDQQVTDNPEAQPGPEAIQGLDEFDLGSARVKNAGWPIDVGGQVVEMILGVEMP
jgi:hypothetical protein